MRLPIRIRLTAWYAALLATILVALGTFVVLQLTADLRDATDRDLQVGWTQIARAYAHEGVEDFLDASATMLSAGRGTAQVLDSDGRILATYGQAEGSPIAPAAAREEALAGGASVFTVALGPDRSRFRTMVGPVQRLGRRDLVVVAESLRDMETAVQRVLVLLLLAGPAALGATAFGGWWLARKALLPVQRMTSKAKQIGIDRLDERIAVPRATDEVGHLAVTLNAMLDRLEAGVREKHRLIADASHELRTPLAVMRAELDVSLGGDDLSAEARAVLESAREEVDRMSRTAGNLLTLAQADEGRLGVLKSRVVVSDAIEAAARPLRRLAAAKDVRLDVDGGSGVAEADPQHLQQALVNLIENAIKFAPSGGEVRIRGWRRDDEVGVTVTDDGPGIPADAQAHIFDRFYRVDRARGRDLGGGGLGLAICDEIARAHGGRVWVESEEGRGSAFSLSLPNNHRSGEVTPAAR